MRSAIRLSTGRTGVLTEPSVVDRTSFSTRDQLIASRTWMILFLRWAPGRARLRVMWWLSMLLVVSFPLVKIASLHKRLHRLGCLNQFITKYVEDHFPFVEPPIGTLRREVCSRCVLEGSWIQRRIVHRLTHDGGRLQSVEQDERNFWNPTLVSESWKRGKMNTNDK